MNAAFDVTDPGPPVSSGQAHAWRTEARQLVRLAAPLAATQLGQMIILATDTFMLGHASRDALAAAALGNTLFFFAWLLGSGPAFAVSPLIAHLSGAGTTPKDIRAVVRMGLWAVTLISLPLLAFLGFTHELLLVLRQQPALAADAGIYISALAWGLPFSLGFQVLRNFSTALSRAVPPLLVMALTILFNAAADYALIFGHFGLPRLGLLGAGIASASSNFFGFAVMLAVCMALPGLKQSRILQGLLRPDWTRLAELMRLGLPIGVTMVFEVALFNGATLAMGTFGTAALAAHQIAITIPSLTFMVPLGIGMAATVRIGLAAGAGDAKAARRAGFVALALSASFMAATAVLIGVFARPIASAWLGPAPGNIEVIALAVLYLHIAAGFQIFDGLQVTSAMSLRGLQDAHAPMWIAGGSYWLGGFSVGIVLGFGLGLKGLGIWLGLAFGLLLAAVLLTARFVVLSKR